MLNRWKWVLVPTYFIAAYVVWANRNFLFDLGNFDESALLFPVFNIARHIVLIGVGGFGLIGLVSIIRKPLFESIMIGRGLKKIGFKNSEGEYAALSSKRRDSRKKHGVIYTFKNQWLVIGSV